MSQCWEGNLPAKKMLYLYMKTNNWSTQVEWNLQVTESEGCSKGPKQFLGEQQPKM